MPSTDLLFTAYIWLAIGIFIGGAAPTRAGSISSWMLGILFIGGLVLDFTRNPSEWGKLLGHWIFWPVWLFLAAAVLVKFGDWQETRRPKSGGREIMAELDKRAEQEKTDLGAKVEKDQL
ncbi:MAG: hypothetical protein IOC63_06910 [Methylobacterium sp.]|nr:hypothetical protein [Methylobacterium sp.]